MEPVAPEQLGRRITAALESTGMSAERLAEVAGVTHDRVTGLLVGTTRVSSGELAEIADQLGLSVLDLLSADEPPSDISSIAARHKPRAEPALEEALERVEVLGDAARLLDQLHASEPRPEPAAVAWTSRSPAGQGEESARHTRRRLGLRDTDPLPEDLADLISLIEQSLDVDIMVEPLPAGLDGLSATQGATRFILLNSEVPTTRLRWTLAHELGHLENGDCEGIVVDREVLLNDSVRETRANVFAGHFLAPSPLLRAQSAGSPLDEAAIARLLGTLRISLQALAYRLHNAGIVNAAERDRILGMSRTVGLREGRVDDLRYLNGRRRPRRLETGLLNAYFDGEASVRPLARLLDVDPDILHRDLAGERFSTEDENRTHPE